VKKFSKLKFNKKTISSLNDVQMSMVKGGTGYCGSGYVTCDQGVATCTQGPCPSAYNYPTCNAACSGDACNDTGTSEGDPTGSGTGGTGTLGGDDTCTTLAEKPCCGSQTD